MCWEQVRNAVRATCVYVYTEWRAHHVNTWYTDILMRIYMNTLYMYVNMFECTVRVCLDMLQHLRINNHPFFTRGSAINK